MDNTYIKIESVDAFRFFPRSSRDKTTADSQIGSCHIEFSFFFCFSSFSVDCFDMGNKFTTKDKRDPTILTEEDFKLLKLNTQYNDEEIEAWHNGFLKDCPSGQLDRKQFLSLYRVKFISIVNKRGQGRFSFFFRDFIPMENQKSIVNSSSKRSIRIITIGLISLNFCETTIVAFVLS